MAADRPRRAITIEIDSAADQRVLGALRAGDMRRAARLMVGTYGGSIYQLCRAVAGSADEAAELAYSSFGRAFSALPEFRASGRPAAWMRDVACARCREVLGELSADGLPQPLRDPSYADGDPDPEALHRFYASLTGVDRAALGLFVFGKVPAPELAMDMRVGVETCRAYMMGVLGAAAADTGLGPPVDPRKATCPPDTPRNAFPQLFEAIAALEFPRNDSLTRRLDVLCAAL